MIQYEFFSERQINKLYKYADMLFEATLVMKLILGLWAVYVVAAVCLYIVEKGKSRRVLAWSGLLLYVITLFWLCVVNRDVGESRNMVLKPFQWLDNNVLHESRIVEAAANFAVFMPFGFFAYWAVKKVILALGLVIFTGMAIEIVQYFTMRGSFMTENIICYILGSLPLIFVSSLVSIVKKKDGKQYDN